MCSFLTSPQHNNISPKTHHQQSLTMHLALPEPNNDPHRAFKHAAVPPPSLSFLIGFCRSVRPGYAHRKTPHSLCLQQSEKMLRKLKKKVIRHRCSVSEALNLYCRAHGMQTGAWQVMWRNCAHLPGKRQFDDMMQETGSRRFSPRLAGLDENLQLSYATLGARKFHISRFASNHPATFSQHFSYTQHQEDATVASTRLMGAATAFP